MNSSVPATIIQMSLKTVFNGQLKKNLQEQPKPTKSWKGISTK